LKPTPAQLEEWVRKAAAADLPLDLEEQDIDMGLPLETHQQQVEIRRIYHELKVIKDQHGLRVTFSWWIFGLVCIWLICVAVCVFLCGFKYHGFALTDKVLITFITSTTINVIGLFAVVAKWMFHPVKQVDDDPKKPPAVQEEDVPVIE